MVVVDPLGKVSYDGKAGLVNTVAISCQASGELVAINEESLSTYGASMDKVAEVSVKGLALMPNKIMDTTSGLFVLGKTRGQQQANFPKILHRIDRSGANFTSLDIGQLPTDLSAAEATVSMRRGAFAWNGDSGKLAYALANPFEIASFRFNGQAGVCANGTDWDVRSTANREQRSPRMDRSHRRDDFCCGIGVRCPVHREGRQLRQEALLLDRSLTWDIGGACQDTSER